MKRKPTSGGNIPSNRWFKSGTVYLLLLAAFLLILFRASVGVPGRTTRWDLTTLAKAVRDGKVSLIQVSQDGVSLRVTRDGGPEGEIVSNKEPNASIAEVLTALGVKTEELDRVKIEVVSPGFWSNWGAILGSILPVLLFSGFIFFMFRQAQGGTTQALSVG